MTNKRLIEKELQRTKEDLEDLETYIGEFSAFLPLAVCTVNPLEIIININEAFKQMACYNPVEIVGEPLETIFLEKKNLEELLKEVRTKEEITTKELTLLSKERKEIPVRVSTSKRKDEKGNFIGYFLAISDITEIKKSREELEERVVSRTKELESRTQEIIESRKALMNMLEDVEGSRKALMNMLDDVEEARGKMEEEKNKTLAVITNFVDGLLVFDKEGELSLINPQAEDFFKIKSKEVIGKSVLELTKIPNLLPLVELLGREIKGIFRKEMKIREDFNIEVSSIPIMREEEQIGTLIVLHDITREKMIERIKTEFVSLTAHQLRTPLSAIKWTLRMLLDGDLGKITEEQKDFIEKTYGSNERMINLINDLLDVTRIEEGRYLYKPVFTGIEPIVQFVINSFKKEMEGKKLKFEFKKPEEKLPAVNVDVEKMKLAIQNLLENAIRYTRPGGEVIISLKYAKGEIELSIKDTGVGIPKDQQARVFTKFFRAANVIRMETEGSGLGLFIAKNIIEAHGGRIWFESEEGKGTTFYFSLPVKEEFGEFLKEF